jgi:hypothetical protein
MADPTTPAGLDFVWTKNQESQRRGYRQFTARLQDGGMEVLDCTDVYTCEDVDAIFAAVVVAALGQILYRF